MAIRSSTPICLKILKGASQEKDSQTIRNKIAGFMNYHHLDELGDFNRLRKRDSNKRLVFDVLQKPAQLIAVNFPDSKSYLELK